MQIAQGNEFIGIWVACKYGNIESYCEYVYEWK
jgi:hypothetical protein